MASRRLTTAELLIANNILAAVRTLIANGANGDTELEFALNRKVYKELSYDERGKPLERTKLKKIKRRQQNNICTFCKKEMPPSYCELDRLTASGGYTVENTNLVHHECHIRSQAAKGYA